MLPRILNLLSFISRALVWQVKLTVLGGDAGAAGGLLLSIELTRLINVDVMHRNIAVNKRCYLIYSTCLALYQEHK
jgi:hypothetical protein